MQEVFIGTLNLAVLFNAIAMSRRLTFAAHKFKVIAPLYDRLCGLVVRVLGYRSGGPGSIPGTTRKKKEWVWNGVHSAS
jgi:hypothetical protein